MPYLSSMTYRDFKHTLTNIKSIDAYIRDNLCLTKTDAFVESLYSLSQREPGYIPMVTPLNYHLYAYQAVDPDLLFIQFHAYFRAIKNAINREEVLKPMKARWAAPTFVIKGDDFEDPQGMVWSESYYASFATPDREKDTYRQIGELRFYYLFDAFLKYGIIATHFISEEYTYQDWRHNQSRFPIIVSTPWVYSVVTPKMITSCADGRIHKHCFLIAAARPIQWHSRPRQIKENSSRRLRMRMVNERLKALRVQRSRILDETRQLKLEKHYSTAVEERSRGLAEELVTSDTDSNAEENQIPDTSGLSLELPPYPETQKATSTIPALDQIETYIPDAYKYKTPSAYFRELKKE